MAKPGFTIIETVLAISLVGAGLIGLLLAHQGASSSALLADQAIIASALARETMEKILAQRDCNETGCGYASTLTSINTSNAYDANPPTGFTGYAIDATALEVNPDNDNTTDDFLDAQSGSGYARITVQVSYSNGQKSLKLTTLITDYPNL